MTDVRSYGAYRDKDGKVIAVEFGQQGSELVCPTVYAHKKLEERVEALEERLKNLIRLAEGDDD